MEERINQLEKLAKALRDESVEFEAKYGNSSALTRISYERYMRITDMIKFITQTGVTVIDYWLKEYGIEGGEN